VSNRLSILIPTKDRCQCLGELLDSLQRSRALEAIRPEIVVGDNGSSDRTWQLLNEKPARSLVPLKILKVTRAGKSAVLNDAIGIATGEILAFLDDDVIVDEKWLEAMARFFEEHAGYEVAQGTIRIPAPESQDFEIQRLLKRYKTIPHLDPDGPPTEIGHLNGSNFALRRRVIDRIGGFDERLGPGASGTSEDVELAHRIRKAGIKIAYMSEVIVYHRVDRSRLTEAYFKSSHKRQGRSRLLISNPGIGRILLNLCRAALQYGFYSMVGNERYKYRGKGRLYHYLAMVQSKYRRGPD
jgi:GT2 family glycosyltransferase